MVRRAAWAVVQSLAVPCRGMTIRNQPRIRALYLRDTDEESLAPYLPYLCRYVLDAAWLEPDPNVRLSMWEPLLTFLTSTLIDFFEHTTSHIFDTYVCLLKRYRMSGCWPK